MRQAKWAPSAFQGLTGLENVGEYKENAWVSKFFYGILRLYDISRV
jgi:hypothetical protein